jgi:hypothetical protein
LQENDRTLELDSFEVEKKVLRSRNLNATAAASTSSVPSKTTSEADTRACSLRNTSNPQPSSIVSPPKLTKETSRTRSKASFKNRSFRNPAPVSSSNPIPDQRRSTSVNDDGSSSVSNSTNTRSFSSNSNITETAVVISTSGNLSPTKHESVLEVKEGESSRSNADNSSGASSSDRDFLSEPSPRSADQFNIPVNPLEGLVELEDDSIDLSAYEEFDFLQEDEEEYCPNGVMNLGGASFGSLKSRTPDLLGNLVQCTESNCQDQDHPGSSWVEDGCSHRLTTGSYHLTASVSSSSATSSSSSLESMQLTSSSMTTVTVGAITYASGTEGDGSPANSEYNQAMPSSPPVYQRVYSDANSYIFNTMESVPSSSNTSPPDSYIPQDFITQEQQHREPESLAGGFSHQSGAGGSDGIVSPMYNYYSK